LLVIAVSPAMAASRDAHGTLKACSIATSGDAAVALDQASTTGRASTAGVFSSCDFSAKRGAEFFTFQIASTSMIKKKSPGQTASSEFKQAKAGAKTSSVKGLGQSAFWIGKYKELWVLKGDVVSSYSFVPLSRAQAAAKRILKKL
jgi:hypothetical protein